MDSLLDVILRESNMRDAIKAVERNNGAPRRGWHDGE